MDMERERDQRSGGRCKLNHHRHDQYKEIAFTAYAVTNMRRARKFYEGILGLKKARAFSRNFIEYDIGRGTLVVGCAPVPASRIHAAPTTSLPSAVRT